MEPRYVQGSRNEGLVSIESNGVFVGDLGGVNEGCGDTRDVQGGRQGEGSVARAEKSIALSDGGNGGAFGDLMGILTRV